jgi:hypothetical protein
VVVRRLKYELEFEDDVEVEVDDDNDGGDDGAAAALTSFAFLTQPRAASRRVVKPTLRAQELDVGDDGAL